MYSLSCIATVLLYLHMVIKEQNIYTKQVGMYSLKKVELDFVKAELSDLDK